MMPVLFSVGSVHIYSLSVALILSWFVFSFIIWRTLRNQGVDEERIFDLTFYSTLSAFLFSRTGYVLTNLDLFRADPLRIAAIWITPGMSLYGALVGALGILVFLSRKHKVRLGHVLDAVGTAFGLSYLVGLIGALLDGSYVGLPASLPWAVRYVGHVSTRHPVQGYEMLVMIGILTAMIFLARRASARKWPYGLLGLWFFALFSVSQFVLEFFKDTHVYLGGLRANQWVLVALFAETMGAFYVRGGGREIVRPIINKVIGGIYGKFSKRST
jgi:phosphatidylglycerol:prolipoprotein diacylglycerol transferase